MPQLESFKKFEEAEAFLLNEKDKEVVNPFKLNHGHYHIKEIAKAKKYLNDAEVLSMESLTPIGA